MDSANEWSNYLFHLNGHTNSNTLENTTPIIAHGDELQPQILNTHTRKRIQGLEH